MSPSFAGAALVLFLLAMGESRAGQANPQQGQAAGALPSVVYPMHDPDTGPADNGGPRQTPPPALPVVQGPPIQYVLFGGVWGWWDRYHHFHPRPVSMVSEPDDHPSKATAGPGDKPPAPVRPGPPARRYVTRLPNPPPRAIVAEPSSPHEHTAGH